VIEVLETVKPTPELVQACKTIKDLGYTLALDVHDFDPQWNALLPYADIIKVDIVECVEQTLIDQPMEGIVEKSLISEEIKYALCGEDKELI
jgi:c-di-GMP-related signal transduction protein